MNKRIKELYKQAFGYFPAPIGDPELEKFAELIVKEAINKIQSVGHKSSNDIPFEITDLFVNNLKQHFGVEE